MSYRVFSHIFFILIASSFIIGQNNQSFSGKKLRTPYSDKYMGTSSNRLNIQDQYSGQNQVDLINSSFLSKRNEKSYGLSNSTT